MKGEIRVNATAPVEFRREDAGAEVALEAIHGVRDGEEMRHVRVKQALGGASVVLVMSPEEAEGLADELRDFAAKARKL